MFTDRHDLHLQGRFKHSRIVLECDREDDEPKPWRAVLRIYDEWDEVGRAAHPVAALNEVLLAFREAVTSIEDEIRRLGAYYENVERVIPQRP